MPRAKNWRKKSNNRTFCVLHNLWIPCVSKEITVFCGQIIVKREVQRWEDVVRVFFAGKMVAGKPDILSEKMSQQGKQNTAQYMETHTAKQKRSAHRQCGKRISPIEMGASLKLLGCGLRRKSRTSKSKHTEGIGNVLIHISSRILKTSNVRRLRRTPSMSF